MKLKDLRAKLDRVKREMRAIIDAPAGDGGNLSDDQATKFDALKAEAETVETAIGRAQAVDDLERRTVGTPLIGRHGDGDFVTRVREGFSLTRALAGQAGLIADWSEERELCQEAGRRAGVPFEGLPIPLEAFEKRVVTSTGSGGNLIGTDHRPDLYIDRLREALVTPRLGARVLSGLMGNVSIPKNTSGDTAAWFTENSALTPADKTFGAVTLSPKHVGMITEYSRNLLLQSSPDIESLLRDDFAKELARAVDRAALSGNGGGGSPVGITNTPNVWTYGGMGAGASWDGVLELIRLVETSNGQMTGFAMGAGAKKAFMTTPRQTGGVEGAFIMTDPRSLAGYPVAVSEITVELGSPGDRPLIAGNWSDLMIGYWSVLDVLVNPFESTAYAKGNVQIRAIVTADVAIRHPESFAFAPDVGPA